MAQSTPAKPGQSALWCRRIATTSVLACWLVACSGAATSAVDITATAATLVGLGSCDQSSSGLPCTAWFQYWSDAQASLTSTPPQVAAGIYTNVKVRQRITELVPGELYHYQFCGYGDASVEMPGLCIGQYGGNAVSAPGAMPRALAIWPGAAFSAFNLSATGNFVTADPAASLPLEATVDLGRVLTTTDVSNYDGSRTESAAVARDGAYSIPISGNTSIWLFGDTGFGCALSQAGQNCLFEAGATAAVGPYVVGHAPTALGELPAAIIKVPGLALAAPPAIGARPASFFPSPVGLRFVADVDGVKKLVDCTPGSFAGSIAGTTLTVGFVYSGKVETGQGIFGAGVRPGTVVTGQISGVAGQAGLYAASVAQTVAYSFLGSGYGTGSYTAAWSSGGAQIPGTAKLLLMHADVCVSGPSAFPSERMRLVEYQPSTGLLSNDAAPFVATPLAAGLNPIETLSSPIFGQDGYLYMYSYTNVCMDNPGCAGKAVYPNAVYVARVSGNAHTAAWRQKANYEWWCGGQAPCPAGPSGTPGWTGAEADARSAATFPMVTLPDGFRVVQPPFEPISVGSYGGNSSHGYVIIAPYPAASAAKQVQFMVLESASPWGPFTFTHAGAVPDACNAGQGCYGVIGHPELSSSRQLVFSWYSADDRLDGFPYPLLGHVRVGAMAW